MKVLHLANDYFGTALYELLFSALETLGVENTVFVPLRHNNTLLRHSVPPNIIHEPCFRQIDRFLYYTKQNRMFNVLTKNVSISDSAVIHAHTLFSSGYLAMRLKEKYGVPYVVTVRSTDKDVFFRYMPHLRRLGVDVMRQAKRIIFLSHPCKNSVITKYVPRVDQNSFYDKSSIVPNGINSFFLEHSGNPKKLINQSSIKLLFIGELRTRKNLDAVLATSRLLLRQGLDVQLRVVGAIIEKKYERMLQSAPFLKYFPRCPKEDILDHLRWSDIFVLPSRSETFGLVYAEAISQGVPVIYTRDEGFDGHFPAGFVGYPVSSKRPNEIVRAIIDILSDYQPISERCVQSANVFSWVRIADDILQIYNEASRGCFH